MSPKCRSNNSWLAKIQIFIGISEHVYLLHGGVYFVLVLNVIATETFGFSDLEGGVMFFPDKKSFRGDHIEDVC